MRTLDRSAGREEKWLELAGTGAPATLAKLSLV